MKPTKENCQTGSVAKLKENAELRFPVSNEPGGIISQLMNPSPVNELNVFATGFYLVPEQRVEILRAPRNYQGINCVYIRDIDRNINGYLYWSEFKKNFNMETLVPGDDLPKPQAEKLATKRERMADIGYYVEYIIDENGKENPMEGCSSVICIGSEANAKYCRYANCNEWYTLQWNCAPSRKFMNTKNTKMEASKSNMFESRYEYYKTWQELVANCRRNIPRYARENKATNDTFSP